MLLLNCRQTEDKASTFEDIVDAYIAYLQVSSKLGMKYIFQSDVFIWYIFGSIQGNLLKGKLVICFKWLTFVFFKWFHTLCQILHMHLY